MLATCNRIEIYTDVDRFHGSVEDDLPRALRARPSSPPTTSCRTSTSTTTTGRSRTCSTWPPAWTRWWSARARSSARSARRSGWRRRSAPPGPPSTRRSSRPCGWRSARTPRPRSTERRPRWCRCRCSARSTTSARWPASARLVVGAGAMASLAVSTLVAAGRRRHRGRQPHGDEGRPARRAVLRPHRTDRHARPSELAHADLLLSCTGSVGLVVTADEVRRPPRRRRHRPARRRRPGAAARRRPDRRRAARACTSSGSSGSATSSPMTTPRGSSTCWASAGSSPRRSRRSSTPAGSPTSPPPWSPCARWRPGSSRPSSRGWTAGCPTSPPEVRAELALAVRRVADKLMHQPTVRVKELANTSGAVSYAAALAELFALDQQAVEAVTRADGVRP